MKVIEVRERFGLDRLVLTERPRPEPGPGRVLVRMRAAALNYRDLLTVRGQYNPKQPLPLIPCSDGVGNVEALGEGVTRVRAGDRVAPIFAQSWLSGRPTRAKLRSTLGGPLDGTLAEFVELDEAGLVHVPPHLTDEAAACLPCAGVTAWNALTVHARIGPGDTILVLGTGGVAIFALQFATLLGARVIVTSSQDAKLERARQLGAWETINYLETPEWSRRVRELTDGEGVDLVVEVGGASTLAQSLSAVRLGGQISLIGVLSGAAGPLNLTPVLMGQVRIQGILVGDRESFEQMNTAIDLHMMRPVVDRVFDWTDVRPALEYLESGAHFGKICLRH